MEHQAQAPVIASVTKPEDKDINGDNIYLYFKLDTYNADNNKPVFDIYPVYAFKNNERITRVPLFEKRNDSAFKSILTQLYKTPNFTLGAYQTNYFYSSMRKYPPIIFLYSSKPEDDEIAFRQVYFYLDAKDAPCYAFRTEHAVIHQPFADSGIDTVLTTVVENILSQGQLTALTKEQEDYFFSEVGYHLGMEIPPSDLWVLTGRTIFLATANYISLLARNYFGFRTAAITDSNAFLLITLHAHIDAFYPLLTPEEQDKLAPLLSQIIKEFVLHTGEWFVSLKDYIDFELDSDAIFDVEDAKKAANLLLKKDYRGYLELNELTRALFDTTYDVLRLETRVTDSICKRYIQTHNLLPSQLLLKESGKYALKQAARRLGISLSPEVSLSTASLARYNYSNLTSLLNNLLKALSITLQTDVFELTLLQMAGITSYSPKCSFYNEQLSEYPYYSLKHTYFVIEYQLPKTDIAKLIDYLNTTYGADTARFLDIPSRVVGEFPIQINLATMINQILPNWHQTLITMLLNKPQAREAWQLQAQKKIIPLSDLEEISKKLALSHHLVPDTKFLTALLLRVFGVSNLNQEALLFQSNDCLESMLYVDFITGISVEQATTFVQNMRGQFPASLATFVNSDDSNSLQLRIDKRIFKDELFLKHLSDELSYLAKNDPDFIEKYQVKPAPIPKKAPYSPNRFFQEEPGESNIIMKPEDVLEQEQTNSLS